MTVTRPTASLDALLILGFVAAFVTLCLWQPRILWPENLANVSRQIGFLAILGIAQMFPILTRGLDLSQGGMLGLISVLFAISAFQFGVGFAAVLSVLFAGICGSASGFLVAYAGVSPFVATLGLGSIFLGGALIISKGQPVFEVPAGFAVLGWTDIAGVPVVFVVCLTIVALVSAALHMTVPGRYLYATGSNERAAQLSGIPTKIVLVSAYAAAGTISGVASLFLSSRINSGHPTAWTDYGLQAIAAAVIGGVSLFGGRGTAVGVLLGAALLGFIANVMTLLNISSYWQLVVVGLAVIIAVALDRIRSI